MPLFRSIKASMHLRGLASPDPAVRAKSARRLGEIGDSSFIAPLIELVDDDAKQVREETSLALGKFGADAVEPSIDTLRRSRKKRAQETITRALARIGGAEAERAVEEHRERLLVAALGKRASRTNAAKRLGELGDPRAIEPLEAALNDADEWRLLRAVADALSSLGWQPSDDRQRGLYAVASQDWDEAASVGPAAVEPLSIAVRDPGMGPMERKAAARALLQAGSERGLAVLLGIVSEAGNGDQRAFVFGGGGELFEVLAEIGDQRAVGVVMRALEGPSEKELQAIDALEAVDRSRVVELLMYALRDRSAFIRSHAAESLGAIGDPRSVEPLIHSLRDKDDGVRSDAAKALGRLGDPRAVEPLIGALKDRWKYTRKAAAEALGRLGDARAVEPLRKIARRDGDAVVRQYAGFALEELEPAAQPPAALQCPRCSRALRFEGVTKHVRGCLCDGCGWAGVWCYSCERAPMKATSESWPDKGQMPAQAWLDCPACSKHSRADYEIISWLQSHNAL